MRVEYLSGEQVIYLLDQVTAVYRAAFAGAPYNRQEAEVAEFARALPVHTKRDGFRSAVAVDENGRGIIGIAYGYRTQPGQWWYDHVSRALGDKAARAWLGDAFQVTEVAVVPEHQRQGIGGAIHDRLLAGLIYPRAVLSTLDAETPGRTMYRNRGWQDLLDGFYFPGVPRRYAIMGRVLLQENA